MKWYFAMNFSALGRYERMIRVAVASAAQHTTLQPHFLFDGPPCHLTQDLMSKGVTVHFGPSSLADEIDSRDETDGYSSSTARGAYLRLEIPRIESQEQFILYTDVDVMFRSEVRPDGFKPRLIMAAGEYDSSRSIVRQSTSVFNSGVMIINVEEFRRRFAGFRDFIRERRFFFHGDGGFYDQGALNAYFKGEFEILPKELNYRIFAKEQVDPVIVHFHGPKPEDIRKLLANETSVYPLIRDLYLRNPEGYKNALTEFDAIDQNL